MRPKFTDIDFSKIKAENPTGKAWRRLKNSQRLDYSRKIAVKSVYSKDDLKGMEHLSYAAGIPPYLRGPYSAMYAMRPWTIRQYAGFSTAEEPNAFYRRNLASGQKDFQ